MSLDIFSSFQIAQFEKKISWNRWFRKIQILNFRGQLTQN